MCKMSKVDLKRDVEKRLKNKFGRKHKRDAKLQELEKQLQFAESRCGTLKQQLDYIKLLYGCQNRSENQVQSSYESVAGGGDNFNYYDFEESHKWMKPEINGSACNKEDGDGPDLINQKASRSNTTCTNSNSSNKRTSTKEENKKAGCRTKSQRNHHKLQTVKKRNPKKLKRKRRGDDTSLLNFSNATSQERNQTWQDPVVEIYKNAAVNAESDIGLEIIESRQKKLKKVSEILLDIRKATGLREGSEWEKEKSVAETEVRSKQSGSINGKKLSKERVKEEGIQTEISMEGLLANSLKPAESETAKDSSSKEPSTPVKPETTYFEPVKSYCQPTISSKRKQVERDVYSTFNNINVRSIPFIVAKSTAPSHNIGVNIQQVLSIIKKRHHLGNENFITSNESGTGYNENNRLATSYGSKKIVYNDYERISQDSGAPTISSQSKKRLDGVSKSTLSHWISNSDLERDKGRKSKEKDSGHDESGLDWSLKVDKLKKVLVLLHEDFTSLSHKYKKLQKKLTKRNISKADAKGELGEIEKDLEKKEEEITVVIGLYKEVLSLRENLKKLQEKYNLVSSGKAFVFDGLKQSNSAHTQMTTLLRKIQNFQDQLKG